MGEASPGPLPGPDSGHWFLTDSRKEVSILVELIVRWFDYAQNHPPALPLAISLFAFKLHPRQMTVNQIDRAFCYHFNVVITLIVQGHTSHALPKKFKGLMLSELLVAQLSPQKPCKAGFQRYSVSLVTVYIRN